MIEVNKEKGIILSGSILNIMSETSALLTAVKKFLTDKLGEKDATFILLSPDIKTGWNDRWWSRKEH